VAARLQAFVRKWSGHNGPEQPPGNGGNAGGAGNGGGPSNLAAVTDDELFATLERELGARPTDPGQ
jgi:hypothetical protein